MDVRSYEGGQNKKLKNKRVNEMGGNHKNVKERMMKWYGHVI